MMALFIVHCSLFIGIAAQAQNFTQRLQTQVSGQGRVILHQDAAIDALVNGGTTVVQTQPTRTVQNPQQPARSTQQNRQPVQQSQQPVQQNQQPVTVAETPVQQDVTDTTDEAPTVPQRMEKVKGFRIQVYNGGSTRVDKQRAEEAGARISSLYPGIYNEVHFYNETSWKCRVGAFRTYREAKAIRDEIRSIYPNAEIVKGDIYVPVE